MVHEQDTPILSLNHPRLTCECLAHGQTQSAIVNRRATTDAENTQVSQRIHLLNSPAIDTTSSPQTILDKFALLC
jgi:hypothetical protein